MDYRAFEKMFIDEERNKVVIYGKIPAIFYWIISPHPSLFKVEEMFHLTWMTWFHYRSQGHWAQGIYFLKDKVKPSYLLSNSSQFTLDEMITTVFNRVNEKESEIDEIFSSMRIPDDDYKVTSFKVKCGQFSINLSYRGDGTDAYYHRR